MFGHLILFLGQHFGTQIAFDDVLYIFVVSHHQDMKRFKHMNSLSFTKTARKTIRDAYMGEKFIALFYKES